MNQLTRAILLATGAHDGQVDKQGEPYILHPLRVMLAMKTESERIVAILHDVLEDTKVTKDDIISAFGINIYAVVEILTRRKFDETYVDYIKRIRPHPMAKKVKLADLADNMSKERIEALPEIERDIVKRYEKAVKILTEERKRAE